MRYRIVVAILAVLAIGGFLVARGASGAPGDTFSATLNSYKEVPAISTLATGTFDAVVLSGGNLDYELSYSNASSTVSAAHIHFGQAGVNGGISAFLCGGGDKPACPATGGMVTGIIDPPDVVGPSGQSMAPGNLAELTRAMRRNATYVNVHTSNHPGGEFRGQIIFTP